MRQLADSNESGMSTKKAPTWTLFGFLRALWHAFWPEEIDAMKVIYGYEAGIYGSFQEAITFTCEGLFFFVTGPVLYMAHQQGLVPWSPLMYMYALGPFLVITGLRRAYIVRLGNRQLMLRDQLFLELPVQVVGRRGALYERMMELHVDLKRARDHKNA